MNNITAPFASPLTSSRPRVHFTLQGKGGVGKSYVSSLLAQYLQRIGTPVCCIDTDPVNDTLSQYRALDSERLDVMVDGRVDEGAFDGMIERILGEPISFIVDSGATSFVALTNHLADSNAFDLLREYGREVIVHCVLAGGQACRDTVVGFKLIAERCAPGTVVVWLNEFQGPVELESEPGNRRSVLSFTEMQAYLDHQEAVLGIITLPRRNADTFGRDIQTMNARRLTFAEVRMAAGLAIVSKSRLARVERELFEHIESVLGWSTTTAHA